MKCTKKKRNINWNFFSSFLKIKKLMTIIKVTVLLLRIDYLFFDKEEISIQIGTCVMNERNIYYQFDIKSTKYKKSKKNVFIYKASSHLNIER
jgi:hypothetical protein